MAIETAAYTVTNAAWTTVNAGTEGTVLLQCDGGPARVYAGGSSPSLTEANYFIIDEGVWFSFQGLESGDYIYARADGADNTSQSRAITVRVMRK